MITYNSDNKDYTQSVAFERCVEFLAAMIEKYAATAIEAKKTTLHN